MFFDIVFILVGSLWLKWIINFDNLVYFFLYKVVGFNLSLWMIVNMDNELFYKLRLRWLVCKI